MSRTFKTVDYQATLDTRVRLGDWTEVEELFALGERAEQAELPEGLVVDDEIALRSERRGPPVLAEGRGSGGRRVVPGVLGVQSEATA